MPCSWDPVRAAVQWHCWKKPFHPPTYIPWKSLLSLLKRGFVSLASALQSSLTRTVPEETKQNQEGSVHCCSQPFTCRHQEKAALQPGAEEEEDEEHLTSRINNHCSRTQPCSFHSEEQLWDTRLSWIFPEILWRGSDSCRWDRGISQKESVVWRQQFSRDGLNTSRVKVCPVSFWSRPLNYRPCWAHAQSCFWSPRDVRRHLKVFTFLLLSHQDGVSAGFLPGVLWKTLLLLHGLTWLFRYTEKRSSSRAIHLLLQRTSAVPNTVPACFHQQPEE